jgi:glycosyltransferase involved in cell wall biosynthesis
LKVKLLKPKAMKPTVSVVIVAHDVSDHLRRAIDSVLVQTYKNIEIIIVYDGLTDGEAHRELVKGNSQVEFYKKEDKGVADALNFAIKKAKGRYFSWLSQDDEYHPEMLAKQVASIGDDRNVIAVSNWSLINQNGRKVRDYTVDDVIEKQPGCFLAFAKDTQINTCAMLFPMAMLRDSKNFNESFPASRDYKMLNDLILAGAKIRLIQESLLNYAAESEDRYVGDTKINEEFDFIRSDIIKTLSFDNIIAYFGSIENTISFYKETLSWGRPRSAAFLMEKIIRTKLQLNDYDLAKNIFLNDLVGLPEDKIGHSVESFFTKIAKPANRKKILFSSAQWLTGGMERVMSTLFRELENDYEIFLITPYDDRQSQIIIPEFVTSLKISQEYFHEHFDATILTYALLLDIDVVTGFINLFDKQLNLYRICTGTKIKTIASNHEYYFYPYKFPTFYKAVQKRLIAFEKCDAVIWPTNFSAALCGMYIDHSYTIGNPNNFGISPDSKQATKENIILCVGRFDDYIKRVDRILECFALVLKKVPDAKLELVGKYDNDAPISRNSNISVNDLINKLAIPPSSINFVGEVDNVDDYYKEAKVLMLTSNSEGFGMVLNEAACFGVPSVCNYIPGIEDIITDGENGYITEQDDIDTMAVRISNILINDGLQNKLGSYAKAKVKSFDAKHIGDKWRLLINSLLELKDRDSLHKKLNDEIGYKIHDQRLLTKVLSKELNEIFYISINEQGKFITNNKNLLLLYKIGKLPRRLRANVEYEGLPKTTQKVLTRSYRIARNKLKI